MKKLYSLIIFALLFGNIHGQSTCPGGLLSNFRFANGLSSWNTWGGTGSAGVFNSTNGCLDTFALLQTTNASTSGITKQVVIQQDSCYNLCYCVGALPSSTLGNVLYLVAYNGTVPPAQIISGGYTNTQAQVLDSVIITTAGLAPITLCNTFTATSNFVNFGVFNRTIGAIGLDVAIDNICLQKISCPPIYYCDSLSAGFTYTATGTTVNFTDQTVASPGNIFGWTWDFGDPASGANNTSNLQNPTHIFTGAGTYNVCLIAAGGVVGVVCFDTICQTITIVDPCDSIVPGFTLTGTALNYNFNNTTTAPVGTILNYTWDFGDPGSGPANTSNLPNPSHTFSSYGSFNVCMYVQAILTSGAICRDTICAIITVSYPCDSLAAAFSISSSGLSSNFTDLSTAGGGGFVFSWNWDFGDPSSGPANTSNLQNPAHTFTASGTYTICLIVGGGATPNIICYDTICQTITVVNPCDSLVPGFTFTGTGFNYSFTNTSTGPSGSTLTYNWDFGDPASGPANTSNLTNPTHTFTTWGTYTVCLDVQALLSSGLVSCRDTFCVTITIPYNCDSLIAGFTSSTTGLSTNFTDISTAGGGSIFTWNWNFGDPSSGVNDTSTLQNPNHVFTATGSYTVCLIISGGFLTPGIICYDTICQTITVSDPCDSLFAGFTSTGTGLNFNFTDISTMGGGGVIAGWYWDFGDPSSGPANNSILQNPSHTFTAPGTYNVCLMVSGTNTAGTIGCHDTICQTITVLDPCDSLLAAFTFTNAGTNYSFTDASTIGGGGIISSWQWDFGDPASGPANSSTLQNPFHNFTSGGTFTVCLIVGGGIPGSVISCYDTICQTITVTDPCDSLIANFSFTNVGNVFTFTDLSTFTGGAITGWLWNFGDPASGPANISNLQNPTHTFTGPGSYTVCLQVFGGTAAAQCRDTLCITVNVPPPPVPCDSLQANFTQTCSGLTCNFTDGSTFPGGAITGWAWDFGDPASGVNNTSSLQNPSHTFTAAGVYVVCLITTGTSAGAICKDTFCIDVVVYWPGIDELSNATVIIVPNPTRDNFTINTAVEIDRYTLTDITGRTVAEQKFTNPVITFPGTCEGGVYLLSLYTRDNKLLVKRVVLQR
jgi:PKD repeat protein